MGDPGSYGQNKLGDKDQDSPYPDDPDGMHTLEGTRLYRRIPAREVLDVLQRQQERCGTQRKVRRWWTKVLSPGNAEIDRFPQIEPEPRHATGAIWRSVLDSESRCGVGRGHRPLRLYS